MTRLGRPGRPPLMTPLLCIMLMAVRWVMKLSMLRLTLPLLLTPTTLPELQCPEPVPTTSVSPAPVGLTPRHLRIPSEALVGIRLTTTLPRTSAILTRYEFFRGRVACTWVACCLLWRP